MMRSKFSSRSLLFSLALLLAIAVGAWLRNDRAAHLDDKGAVAQVPREPDPILSVPYAPNTELVSQVPQPAKNEIDSMAAQLETTTNYRALFESLLQSKSNGRTLYALSILATCRNVQTGLSKPADASATVEQQRARDLAAARCSTFTNDEISGQRIFELVRDPRLKDDQYRSLQDQWAQGQTSARGRTQVLQIALTSNDPVVLASINTFFYKAGEEGAFFDGAHYTEPYAQQVFGLAWLAAVCEGTGTECGKQDPYVTDACAANGACFDNRQSVLANAAGTEFGPAAGLFFQSIYTKLVAAIKNKDISAFNAGWN